MQWFKITNNVFVNLHYLVRVDRTGVDTNKLSFSDGSNVVISDSLLLEIKNAMGIYSFK